MSTSKRWGERQGRFTISKEGTEINSSSVSLSNLLNEELSRPERLYQS